jgi:triacylglycerol lipase
MHERRDPSLLGALSMNQHLTLLACGAVLQACAAGGTDSNGSFERGVAPTVAAPDGRHVGFVLAHGLAGSVDSFDPAIVSALQADGYYVMRDAVPPVDSVEHRAAVLADQLDAFVAANQLDRVHVIAHSMGGLDARYLISTLGYGARITSLTTLGTPHRGSPLADIALGITDDLTTSQEDALLAFTDVVGSDVDAEHVDLALTDLAEASAPAFNAANPDAEGVTYRSYAGYSTLLGVPNINAWSTCRAPGARTPSPSSLPGVLQLAGPIIGGLWFRPHDGVVPIDSAKWTGFAGCIPADHLDMTRAGAKDAADLDLALVPFYRGIAAQVGAL